MQKVINVLAVLSFLGTASIIGGGVYVYLQKDALIESAKERVTKAATEAIAGACLLYTSPSPRDATLSRMPSSA